MWLMIESTTTSRKAIETSIPSFAAISENAESFTREIDCFTPRDSR